MTTFQLDIALPIGYCAMPLFLQYFRNLEPPVAPYGMDSLPLERVVVPMTFPLISKSIRWQDDYNIIRDGFRHTGLDIRAPKMTPIVAPFSGTIGFKIFSFWIYGDNGYKCLGTHLNDDTPGTDDNSNQEDFMFAPNLSFGDHVEEGQLIGYVGNSRGATGPHLHFDFYTPNGIRNAFPSLQVSRRISEPVLGLRAMSEALPPGQERLDGCIRKVTQEAITILLVARTSKSNGTRVIQYPTYIKLIRQPDSQVDVAALNSAKPASVWTFYAEPSGSSWNLRKAFKPAIIIKVGPRHHG